jgi:hypothetical protein
MTEPDSDAPDLRAGGTSPHGLPFPSASDPVAGGAAAIEALARSVDTKVLSNILDWDTVIIQDRGDAWVMLTATGGIVGPGNYLDTDGRAMVRAMNGQRWYLASGSSVITLNANGDWTIYYGLTFSGPPTVVVTNGDTNAVPSCMIGLITTRADGFDLHVTAPGGGPAGAIAIRVNWMAFGVL